LSTTLGIQPESEKQAMGAAGPVKLTFAHVASLVAGSTRKCDLQVAITDELKRIAAAIGNRVDGSLGFEFLKDFSVTIDYHAGTIGFSSPSDSSPDRLSVHSSPFTVATADKPLILVQVMVNGHGPFQFVLDTGASRTMLSSDLSKTLGLETTEDAPVTGGGGQIRILAGKLNSLAVGHAIVRDHAVGVGEFLAMLSRVVGTKLDGIVGYNFLSQFRVTIAFPRRTLELVLAGRIREAGGESSIRHEPFWPINRR
jgi:Aspartyl protease